VTHKCENAVLVAYAAGFWALQCKGMSSFGMQMFWVWDEYALL
jgi:hypothetical protein